MNLFAPISTIMTAKVISVSPNDSLAEVNELFKKYKIHHVPVVKERKLVGIVSKSDINLFLKWWNNDKYQDLFNGVRLAHYTTEDLMTKGVAKLEPTDKIFAAVKVFEENLFHAIPVVNSENELEGMVTTYDLIKLLVAEVETRHAAIKN